MIFKCVDCNQPMTESQKKKPKDIPKENKWILCRECNKGVEVIGDIPQATTASAPSQVDAMRFTETKVNYVEIRHNDGITTKSYYSDDTYEKKIGEEELK